jgi:DNA-binding PadR family transcriptional regulator
MLREVGLCTVAGRRFVMPESAADARRPGSAARKKGSELPLPRIGVLVTLSDCPGPVGKYEIVKSLRSLFPATTVYNAISQMADAGLLDVELMEGARGSRPGYFCTAEGLKALRSWARWPPTELLAPSPEMLLWLSAARVRRPDEVLHGINVLVDLLHEQDLKLQLDGSRTRRDEGWGLAAELEYGLERAALDAARQFVALAKGRYEEKVAVLSSEKEAKSN